MARIERTDYWNGFQFGIRRAYYGEVFSMPLSHDVYIELEGDRGDGYRAGFAALDGAQIDYKPSSEAVLRYLRDNRITGGQAARMMYLSGSNQVRKYTGGEKPRQMDGARWFCLHAHNVLSPEQIAQIEAAMLADLGV